MDYRRVFGSSAKAVLTIETPTGSPSWSRRRCRSRTADARDRWCWSSPRTCRRPHRRPGPDRARGRRPLPPNRPDALLERLSQAGGRCSSWAARGGPSRPATPSPPSPSATRFRWRPPSAGRTRSTTRPRATPATSVSAGVGGAALPQGRRRRPRRRLRVPASTTRRLDSFSLYASGLHRTGRIVRGHRRSAPGDARPDPHEALLCSSAPFRSRRPCPRWHSSPLGRYTAYRVDAVCCGASKRSTPRPPRPARGRIGNRPRRRHRERCRYALPKDAYLHDARRQLHGLAAALPRLPPARDAIGPAQRRHGLRNPGGALAATARPPGTPVICVRGRRLLHDERQRSSSKR